LLLEKARRERSSSSSSSYYGASVGYEIGNDCTTIVGELQIMIFCQYMYLKRKITQIEILRASPLFIKDGVKPEGKVISER
jgi:hypothetical protein